MGLLEWTVQSSLVVAVLTFIGFAAALGYLMLKYPIGPSWFASVTTMVFHSEDLADYMKIWKLQFGHVYAIFNGRNPRVFITNYDAIVDAFVHQAEACSSRQQGTSILQPAYVDKGIVASPHWKEQRRFALTVLRDHGVGKIDMGNTIMEEVGPFLRQLEEIRGHPIDINSYMHRSISNVICNLVLGSRFDYDDPFFVSFLNSFQIHSKDTWKMINISSMLLKYLPGDIFGYHKYVEDEGAIIKYFTNVIHQHKKTLDTHNPRDFIDAYLIKIKESEQEKKQSSFDEMNCVASVMELFVAGTDTTANTLMWAWLFMMEHPDVQQRLQKEIDQSLGVRPPSLTDKARMPYTEAVLTEVMRLANTALLTLPHNADADMTIAGHLIPKDALIHASLLDVHLDDCNYLSPYQFNPQRFLTQEGVFEQPKKFIPFGIGRRACPGESLARAELFLFFTSVLQRFNIESPNGNRVGTKGKAGFVHHPPPYLAIFKQRCSS